MKNKNVIVEIIVFKKVNVFRMYLFKQICLLLK